MEDSTSVSINNLAAAKAYTPSLTKIVIWVLGRKTNFMEKVSMSMSMENDIRASF